MPSVKLAIVPAACPNPRRSSPERAQQIDAAAPNAGAMPSSSCWRYRPNMPTGSPHSPTACATAPPPTHSKPSSISTLQRLLTSSCHAASAVTDRTQKTQNPENRHPAPSRTRNNLTSTTPIREDSETIHVTRPKMRRAQSYPMSVPVGEAILRYLRLARPRSPLRSLFLTIQAPIRPLSGPSITYVVRTLLTRQGVKLSRRGAHSLRHACAGQLLDAGFTLKQIADHLGHRSLDTTRIYTKIDLRGLRQVAEFDLGALL